MSRTLFVQHFTELPPELVEVIASYDEYLAIELLVAQNCTVPTRMFKQFIPAYIRNKWDDLKYTVETYKPNTQEQVIANVQQGLVQYGVMLPAVNFASDFMSYQPCQNTMIPKLIPLVGGMALDSEMQLVSRDSDTCFGVEADINPLLDKRELLLKCTEYCGMILDYDIPTLQRNSRTGVFYDAEKENLQMRIRKNGSRWCVVCQEVSESCYHRVFHSMPWFVVVDIDDTCCHSCIYKTLCGVLCCYGTWDCWFSCFRGDVNCCNRETAWECTGWNCIEYCCRSR